MSCFLDHYPEITGDLNIYYNASVNSIAADEPITFPELDDTLTNNFSLSKSGAQFTLPNDGKTYLLEAHVLSFQNNSYLSYQWYDVTNSQYVGIKGIVTGGNNDDEGRQGDVVGDEKAVFVTNQNNTYELRLLAGNSTSVDSASPGSYYTRPRCCIWRL